MPRNFSTLWLLQGFTHVGHGTNFDFAFYAHRCQHSPWLISSVCMALTAALIGARQMTARRLRGRCVGSIHLRDQENDI
jgi:hypothetical protein